MTPNSNQDSTNLSRILEELQIYLCDLSVVERSLTVNGAEMFYWVYQATKQLVGCLPVIMIHGGPGLCHNYMLPLKQIA